MSYLLLGEIFINVGGERTVFMLSVKKLSFSREELELMADGSDGYAWAVVDVKKGVMAAGDEYVGTMKNALLKLKSCIFDVFSVGVDLITGEINYCSPVNKKLIDKNSTKEVPEDKKERVETLVKYFFSELPIFKSEERKSRYSKRV
ncbi:hypothetical protein FWF89_03040 [Candidatus Saccharibacteria bacterium]|nr:hypothetical protein [Candidatus Saccharibacteria bacterium]